MKITIISYDNWNFNQHIVNELIQKGHIVRHINFFTFKHTYPNFRSRLKNFILKNIFGKNIKNAYYGQEILRQLAENTEEQDVILTIKGEFIDPKSIAAFKKYGKKSIAFFNDGSRRCPKIKKVLPYFDQVYSFEKDDCIKYNLQFISNWIYPITPLDAPSEEFMVYNISSIDRRLPLISKIAGILKENGISYKIIIYDKKNRAKDPKLQYTKKPIALTEVNQRLQQAKILLDFNRPGQNGLSFRVFESIGLEKKLITTNMDIKNYDFYNPNNILIIDEKNPKIPLSFFQTDYQELPKTIRDHYQLSNWIQQLFGESNTPN